MKLVKKWRIYRIPYTPEAYAALLDFRAKLKLLDHNIRTLLRRDDLVKRLIASTDLRLLTVSPNRQSLAPDETGD